MKKKIVIAGGTGLVGQHMISMMDQDQYDIYILSRSESGEKDGIRYVNWNTRTSHIDNADSLFKDVYGIINLAGAGIADKRWTDERKKVILDSRILSSDTLIKTIEQTGARPKVMLSASAVGYYGDRKEEKLTEDSLPGEGFISDVCVDWEKANLRADSLVDRNVILRIGIVLSGKGGALHEILKTTITGIYGYFGNGKAYYPWIHIDDLCRMFLEGLEDEKISGIYNASAEEPVTIKELVAGVRKAKGGFGPLLPVPGFGLRIALGQMATMLLNSTRAIPQAMMRDGFAFKFKTVTEAVKDILHRDI